MWKLIVKECRRLVSQLKCSYKYYYNTLKTNSAYRPLIAVEKVQNKNMRRNSVNFNFEVSSKTPWNDSKNVLPKKNVAMKMRSYLCKFNQEVCLLQTLFHWKLLPININCNAKDRCIISVHLVKYMEGHKILRNLHQLFVLCTASQIIGGDWRFRIYEV